MTTKPDFSETPKTPTVSKRSISVLDDLFNLGYTTSGDILLYEHEDKRISAAFRTLVPAELRDVHECIGAYSSIGAKIITEQIELLARGVVMINNMPLILDQHDREELAKKDNVKDPSPLEQARYILLHKLNSKPVLDLLYGAYMEFLGNIDKEFEEIKKKLKKTEPSA